METLLVAAANIEQPYATEGGGWGEGGSCVAVVAVSSGFRCCQLTIHYLSAQPPLPDLRGRAAS